MQMYLRPFISEPTLFENYLIFFHRRLRKISVLNKHKKNKNKNHLCVAFKGIFATNRKK